MNPNTRVDLIDLDPDGVTRAQITAFKARGTYTVCYVSVGTAEDWRDDFSRFPADVKGRAYEDWEGEYFLDVRQQSILLPIMEQRFRACKALGFQAIEPDNIDIHHEDTGFPLTAKDMVAYVKALEQMAHRMGLAIGQKNAPDLAATLQLDFLLLEECAEHGFCDVAKLYKGKPVLNAEYNIPPAGRARVCAQSKALGILTIFKTYDLDTTGSACR